MHRLFNFSSYFVTILLFCLILSGLVYAEDKPTADHSLESIKQKNNLIIGMDIPYGVMEFYDASGQAKGIDVDIAHEIANSIGVANEIKNMPFSELFNALNNGTVDLVISAVTITPERQKTLLFSTPYLDAGLSIAVEKNNDSIRSVADLKNKRVGVLKGTIAEELAKDSPLIDNYVSFEKNDERVNALLNGEIDAAIVHFLTKDIPALKIVGQPLSQSYYGVVAKKDHVHLMNAVNKALRALKRTGKINMIKGKYLTDK